MKKEIITGRLLRRVVLALTLLFTFFMLASCGPDTQRFLTSAEAYRSLGQIQASIIESKNAIKADPTDSRGYTSTPGIA